MTEPAWQPRIGRLDAANPDAARLARLASLAVRVEPRLLRRLRLRFLPRADAGCEADVWFSALVAVRDPAGFSWAPGAADALRAGLAEVAGAAGVDLAELRAAIAELHAGAPPLVQLEEEIAWLAVRGAPRAEIERALGRAVRALDDHPAHADDLAAWAVHALPDLPEAARGTAAAWQLRMAAASRFGVAPPMGVAAPDDLLRHVVRGVLADRGRERLQVVRDADQLWLEAAPGTSDTDPDVLTVPATRPLWVEVSSDHGRRRGVVAVEPGRRAQLDAASGDVLRSALGDAWVLESARVAQLGADADADAGEVLVGWVIVRLPPDAPLGWESVRDDVLADLARSAGRAGRIDLILLLANDVPLAQRLALDAIGDELRAALGPASHAHVVVTPVPVHGGQAYGEGAYGEGIYGGGNAPAVELRPTERAQVIVRASERPEAWPVFSDRVVAAMQGRDLMKGWDSKDSPADVVIAIGNGAARLAERRFPVTVPLLILDDASPWALPPPGVRIAGPPPLWSGAPYPSPRPGGLPPGACYALGCVRRVQSRGEGAPATAQLTTVERSWASGEWRERTSRSPRFDLHYPGDRDHGWNRDDVAIVIGDPERDHFVEELREWWSSAGRTERPSFVAVERLAIGDDRLGPGDEDLAIGDIRIRLPVTEATRRVWLFVRERATRRQIDAVVRKLGTAELIGFFDHSARALREVAYDGPERWLAVATEPSIVTGDPDPRPSGSTAVTSAGLEALSCAVRGDAWIGLGHVRAHLTARLGHGAVDFLDTLRPSSLRTAGTVPGDGIAPAPKHARVDTRAMRRVFGGAQRERPEIPPGARVVFLTGRHAVSRSAWLDRWLQPWTEPPLNEPRPVFGWTPWLLSPGEMLVYCRGALVDWSFPARPLDDVGEIAWRVEGSGAVFVLDGLGREASDVERQLIAACARNRAGLLIVSTPQIAGWMRQLSGIAIIDLDVLESDVDLTRGTRLEPSNPGWIAVWIQQLANLGHDRPVLVAIALARAVVAAVRDESAQRIWIAALDAWLVDGDLSRSAAVVRATDPTPSEEIAWFAVQARNALSSGDPERMLAWVQRAVELAVATLGFEPCARALGAPLSPVDQTSATGPASISIAEADGGFRVLGHHVSAGSRGEVHQILAVLEPHELADPRASKLRSLKAVTHASLSEPVAIYLSGRPSTAAVAWELALTRAMAAPDGEADLLRRTLLFRAPGGAVRPMRTVEQLVAEWPRRADVMSLVGSEAQADGARAAFGKPGAGRARAAFHQVLVQVYPPPGTLDDHRGWSLHILGGPLDEAAVQLQADFAPEQATNRAVAGTRVDLRRIVQQVQPPVLILQDVPTALATALQARQRAERLRVLAADLAETVPLIVVIPALEHDHAPRILHLLSGALAEDDIAAALITAVARARKLLLDRAAGNLAAVEAVAGDVVIWASGGAARRPYHRPGVK